MAAGHWLSALSELFVRFLIVSSFKPEIQKIHLKEQKMSPTEVTFNVPLEITVRIGQAVADLNGDLLKKRFDGPIAESGVFEAARPASFYDDRTGYSEGFLGFPVPLVQLTEEQRRNAAKNSAAKAGYDPTVLRYTNFSVVVNRRRQLAYYTAVNIDGSKSQNIVRDKDKWYFDSRIAETEQIGEDLYKRNNLDRGHLVRRLDPVWGPNASRANDDTFHFTNCSPQHAKFNQGQDLWQGLENYILEKADARDQKVTVFTGPVMDENDPLYRGVRLPLAFWKIIAYVKNNKLRTAAFVLEQGKLIEKELAFEADFQPGAFRVKIDHLKKRTGLALEYFEPYEVALSENGFEAAFDRIEIKSDYSNLNI